jgi:hypothetical protein
MGYDKVGREFWGLINEILKENYCENSFFWLDDFTLCEA